jgi:hypothetical protein
MFRRLPAALVAALLSATACGDDDDAGNCADAAATNVFADPCSTDCECASNLCFTYGDGTSACTIECSSNDECPEGSQGKKCNGQGVCRS